MEDDVVGEKIGIATNERVSFNMGLVGADSALEIQSNKPPATVSPTKTIFGYSRGIVCGAFVAINLVFWLPITFCAIIPSVMQDIVNKSEITIQSITITAPTSTSFQASNIQTFSNTGSITATGKVSYLHITWDEPGGGTMLRLGSSNSFTVKNNEQVSLTADAVIVNDTAFTDFNLAAIADSGLTWHLTGNIDVTYIVTATCSLDKNVPLVGFSNFPINPNVTYVNTTGGSSTMLHNIIYATMTSLSNINIDFQQTIYFLLKSEGIPIGAGYIPDYSILSGLSDVQAYVNIYSTNAAEKAQVERVLTNYSTGFLSSISMEQFSTATKISWLAPALETIVLQTEMPPVNGYFIVNVTMYAKLNVFSGIQVTIFMYNPVDTGVTVVDIGGYIVSSGQKIATLNVNNLDFVIPSHQTKLSPMIEAAAVVTGPGAQVYLDLISAGQGFIDVHTPILFNISEFGADVNFVQLNVPVFVVPA